MTLEPAYDERGLVPVVVQDANTGDVLMLVADETRIVLDVLGQIRLEYGQPTGHDELTYLFVVDFPVFERNEDGDFVALHHPFTAPVDVTEMRENPGHAISKAYDLVLNGSELGSGSVRIHDPAVQAQVFEVLGINIGHNGDGRGEPQKRAVVLICLSYKIVTLPPLYV